MAPSVDAKDGLVVPTAGGAESDYICTYRTFIHQPVHPQYEHTEAATLPSGDGMPNEGVAHNSFHSLRGGHRFTSTWQLVGSKLKGELGLVAEIGGEVNTEPPSRSLVSSVGLGGGGFLLVRHGQLS